MKYTDPFEKILSHVLLGHYEGKDGVKKFETDVRDSYYRSDSNIYPIYQAIWERHADLEGKARMEETLGDFVKALSADGIPLKQLPYDAEEDAANFVQVFSTFCNNMNDEPQKLAVAALMREHRTIQQKMMRFFMLFVENMAGQSYDLRNEASVKLAEQIQQIPDRYRILPNV
jgi:hypothetical protein